MAANVVERPAVVAVVNSAEPVVPAACNAVGGRVATRIAGSWQAERKPAFAFELIAERFAADE